MNSHEYPRAACGFTLIELLIVLAIVAILSSIAYPSYADHVRKVRRLEGKLALLEVMHAQENQYGRGHRYFAFSATDPAAAEQRGLHWWSGASAAASAYELHAQPCAGAELAQCVEVVATPGTRRVDGGFRDAECGALTLSSTGEQRAATGASGCWP